MFVTLWIGLLISACDQSPRNDSALEDRLQKTDAALEVRLKKADGALEDRLQKAENDLASLRTQLDKLKSEREWENFYKDLDKVAYLWMCYDATSPPLTGAGESMAVEVLGVQRGSVLIWPGALIERHQQGYGHENCKQKSQAP